MGSLRSASTPSSAIATVRLASEGEMPWAISSPVVSLGYSRFAPSGKVRVTFSTGSTGLRLVIEYWNPDSDLWSVMVVSFGSLLRTSAGKREHQRYSRRIGRWNTGLKE